MTASNERNGVPAPAIMYFGALLSIVVGFIAFSVASATYSLGWEVTSGIIFWTGVLAALMGLYMCRTRLEPGHQVLAGLIYAFLAGCNFWILVLTVSDFAELVTVAAR